ncbi:MAG: glycoside hydrolase family 95 protein, partial [Cytophagales bacterium]|nr:glycoside hydrolase family 95 protein [Cytophagales bacterium]
MRTRPPLLLTFCFLLCLNGAAQTTQPPMLLWYQQPATVGDSLPYQNGKSTQPFDDRHRKGWVEALPIGNGRMGAMVFGGVPHERIQLNEETLWAGYRHDENNPNAAAALPIVRRLIFEGKEDSAKKIGEENMLGVPKRVSPFQSMGDVWITFPGLAGGQVTNYYRDLDVDQAVASVRFGHGNTTFTREAFASHPDDVIVLRFAASEKGSLSLGISLHREKEATAGVQNNTLVLQGRLNVPDAQGVNQGMAFETHVRPLVKGGAIRTTGNGITIQGADEVVLLIAQATGYGGRNPREKCRAALAAAAKRSYDQLKRRHVEDYRKLYG